MTQDSTLKVGIFQRERKLLIAEESHYYYMVPSFFFFFGPILGGGMDKGALLPRSRTCSLRVPSALLLRHGLLPYELSLTCIWCHLWAEHFLLKTN